MRATSPSNGKTPAQWQQQMEQALFNLCTAEERGMPPHVLERLYQAYMVALRAYYAAIGQPMPGEHVNGG
jgi:hypothetical protein